jgi:hypothetical protein
MPRRSARLHPCRSPRRSAWRGRKASRRDRGLLLSGAVGDSNRHPVPVKGDGHRTGQADVLAAEVVKDIDSQSGCRPVSGRCATGSSHRRTRPACPALAIGQPLLSWQGVARPRRSAGSPGTTSVQLPEAAASSGVWFLADLDLVEPGLVPVEQWRPDPARATPAIPPCGGGRDASAEAPLPEGLDQGEAGHDDHHQGGQAGDPPHRKDLRQLLTSGDG